LYNVNTESYVFKEKIKDLKEESIYTYIALVEEYFEKFFVK